MQCNDEKDYIMRMIKETARILFSLALKKDYVQAESSKESDFNVSREEPDKYKAMIDAGKINEAENLLLENIDYTDSEEMAAAILFYQYIGEKDDAFLQEHNYSLEEALDGLKQLASHAGYKDVFEVLKETEQTDD